ncbi:MAG: PKD domain-containing protein [Ferruginibacter sp.]|nr:PKD domain-containing protein [Cytophagales bacterium]
MKKTLLFFLLAGGSFGANGQALTGTEPKESVQPCATMAVDSLLRLKYPGLGTLADLERDLRQKMAELEVRNAGARTEAEILTIPVVVHVIYNGEAPGQGTNISAAQVQSQLDVLNEDFRRLAGSRGFNSNPVGADVEIGFCPAAVNPNGGTLSERGIHRYNGGRPSWSQQDIENVLKPATSWDPDKYFNIWVVPDLSGTVSGGTLLGYAQFPIQSNLTGLPSGGPASTDGVVVRVQAFGSADKGTFPILNAGYNRGRTLTHETGHWLGLRHIWGDGPCADDFCSDTPTADGPSEGCPRGRTSCGGTNQVENYMDYTQDVCMNVFTQCQKTRMRTVMQVSPRRSTLLSSNVCGTLVAARPVTNFGADKARVLRGGRVLFSDLSTNFPTAWRWTFEGGEPATATDRNPTVTYGAPGLYRVKLVTTNAIGSDSLTREGYIAVSSEGLCSSLSNFGNGTRSVLKGPVANLTRGYVAGHNNLKHQAKAEYFSNDLGYANLSGATLRFGLVKATGPDATVRVTAWNARGLQGSPGAVLESKLIPVRTIQQDLASGVPTRIGFDRNVPLFGRGFYVGIELAYAPGDTVALVTTRDGESQFSTAWERDSTGAWQSYAISRGQNLAHDVTAVVGMNASVQLASSAIFVRAGEPVTLNARGASIFAWGPDNAGLNTTLGPQVIARPTQTTTYTVTGSGLELCNAAASFTVFVTGTVTALPPALDAGELILSPNPGTGQFRLNVRGGPTGKVRIEVLNVLGNALLTAEDTKPGDAYERTLALNHLPGGTYVVRFSVGQAVIRKKIVKL